MTEEELRAAIDGKSKDEIESISLYNGATVYPDRYDEVWIEDSFLKARVGEHETWHAIDPIVTVAFTPPEHPIGNDEYSEEKNIIRVLNKIKEKEEQQSSND